VARARVLDPRSLKGQSRATFTRALRRARVDSVRRRAKFVLAQLDRGRSILLVHLGMAGKMLLAPKGERLPRWSRVILYRDDGARVVFRDSRVFGKIQVHSPEALQALPTLRDLGPEPLDPGFRARDLGRALEGSSRAIKVLLLDQSRVAGLGNIQAAESLYMAGIHPGRPARDLDREEVHRLWKAIRASLRETIRRARAPEIAYVEEPGAENPFRVYGREGEPCPRCGEPFLRIVQAARSTYFCARCQPS
jgi:formamidopyrimidine-DNA glycosylase